MFDNQWENWCRLCGSEHETKIILNYKKDFGISEVLQNLLLIQINEIHLKICLTCHELISSVNEFSAKALKIQEMFIELEQKSRNDDIHELNIIRTKYGLNRIIKNTNSNLKIEMEEEQYDNEIIIKAENQTQIQEANKELFKCEICEIEFSRNSRLESHLKNIHSIDKKLIVCEVCKKTCATQVKLTIHMESHFLTKRRPKRSTHPCPHCQQMLSTEGTLKEHIRYKHTGEKPFVCDQCGKSFTTKQDMKTHKYIHETNKEFNCAICSKTFRNVHRVKVHMKVHRENVYPCSVCGLKLKTQRTLKNHLVIHTDEMPFICNYCGQAFRRDKNLRAHMIIHTGLKPYECSFCSLSYSNRSNCKKHEKHSHPDEFAIMEATGIQHYSKNVPKLSQLQSMLETLKADKKEN